MRIPITKPKPVKNKQGDRTWSIVVYYKDRSDMIHAEHLGGQLYLRDYNKKGYDFRAISYIYIDRKRRIAIADAGKMYSPLYRLGAIE